MRQTLRLRQLPPPPPAQLISTTCAYLKAFFFVIVVIANAISLFSIVSSFTIFVFDHAREINILRAIGFNKRQVTHAYVHRSPTHREDDFLMRDPLPHPTAPPHPVPPPSFLLESFSIISSPLILGLATGTLLSYLICVQQTILIDVPMKFSVNIYISYLSMLPTLLWWCHVNSHCLSPAFPA